MVDKIFIQKKVISFKHCNSDNFFSDPKLKLSATLKTVAAFTLRVKLNQKETSTISLPNEEQVNIPGRGIWPKLCKFSGS